MKFRKDLGVSARARQFAGAASAIALSCALSGPAFAQTAPAPEPEVEVVVVTGIRAALQNAINTKKNLDVISESVSAEDIGKLPDVSIAESIARLPGLAAERIDGRAQRISIRGLGPDFTTSLLNGREQVSTNDGRGIEFDQFPGELLSGVNIYKTTQAGLAAQGIAGTADLRTVRPLAYGRRALVVTGRYQVKSLGEVLPDVDPNGFRLTGSYIDQFMDGKLGIALGVAHMYDPSGTQRTEAYDTDTRNARAANPTNNQLRLGNNIQTPGGVKVMASTTELTRTGLMGVLEYRPTDNFSMVVDAYYSTMLSEQNNRGLEANFGQRQDVAQEGWLANTIRTENGYAVAGTFRGRYAIRNIYNENDAEVKAFGVHADYNLTTKTKVGFDFGYSAADRDTIFIETQPCYTNGLTGAARECNRSDLNYSIDGDGRLQLSTTDNLADPNRVMLADPYGWGAQGFVKRPTIKDELKTYRLDLVHEFGENAAIKSIEVGVNYADRRKERTFREEFLRTPNAVNGLSPIPSSLIAGTVDLGFGGLGNALVFNANTARATGAIPTDTSIGGEWWQGNRDWNVDEKITTVFFKANIDSKFAGVPVTGNFGIQYIHNDQSSDGVFAAYFLANNGADGGTRPVSDGVDYGEVLPSLNLSFEVQDDLFVRVGLGRVLSRPNMEFMRVTREINFNFDNINSLDPYRSPYTGDGGNPLLRPTISNNADLSIEKYFGRKGVVSLAVFQKNLETYLRPGGDRYFLDLSGYPSPSWIRDSAGNVIRPRIQTAFVTTPGNAEGGTLQGVEFALSLPFDLFSQTLDGFGAYFNISQNFSDVEFADSRAGRTELPGLSKTTGNLAFYYEKHGFQARINARYRSSYLQDIVAFDANIERRITEPETIVDAQVGYEFGPTSPLKGLSIILQASNLTDEPWQNYYENPYRGLNYDTYGTTYQLGLTYKF